MNLKRIKYILNMFIKFNIQGDIFCIINDLCIYLNNILDIYKISNKNKCFYFLL